MMDKYITFNFRYDELASRGELPGRDKNIFTFANMAQELREWAADSYEYHEKNGLILSNWYRTEKHNTDVGGDKNSIHLNARAMDITNVKQNTFEEFMAAWRLICKQYNKIGGINFYSWGIHIDDYEDKFGHKKFVVRDMRK